MRRLLLGIDVGTTGVKVGLFGLGGEMLALSRRDHPTYRPQVGYAEQYAEDWWQGVTQGIGDVLEKAGVLAKQVAAIGVDSMTPCLLPLDRLGTPLGPVQIWADSRAQKEVQWIGEHWGEQIRQVSGNRLSAGYLAPKVLWLRRQDPDVFAGTYQFLQPNGYINLKLTGRFSMDRSHSELTLLADKETGQWSEGICEALGIPREKLPEVQECRDLVGLLTREAASQTGLMVGTPVVAGGNDTAMSAYALNVRKPRQAILDIGTASNLGVCVRKPRFCSMGDLYHHVVPGLWVSQIYSGTTGAAFRWFKEQFGQVESKVAEERGESVYDLLVAEAAKAAVGSAGVLFVPYLSGAQDCAKARGGFLGISASTTRADMVRALLEGCALAVRYNMRCLEEAAGFAIEEISLGGGGANSAFWCQVHADVLGKTLVVAEAKDSAILGSALLAGVGAGLLDEDVNLCSGAQSQRVYQPDPSNVDVYDRVYERFLQVRI